jgi:hypothetical protein
MFTICLLVNLSIHHCVAYVDEIYPFWGTTREYWTVWRVLPDRQVLRQGAPAIYFVDLSILAVLSDHIFAPSST